MDFEVPYKIQVFVRKSKHRWYRWCFSHFVSFVANVNVDGGQLKVNVNRFSNTNVWNADNRHRVVVPQHIIFSLSFSGGVFK